MKPLNVFIIGAGKVGIALIEALVKEGNNVTLIDVNESKIRDISGQYDIMACQGNGASHTVLVENGIKNADILIAVTPLDELNILCCVVASQVSNCKTIARVRTPDYSREVSHLRARLGISMVINPELEAAGEISQILNYPGALDVNTFSGGEARMVTFKVRPGSSLIGRMLPDIMKSLNVDMLFTAAERDGVAFIPNGNYEFKENDILAFVTGRRRTVDCLKALGIFRNPVKNCLIVGGGKGAYYLADHLLKAGLKVKIIEKNYERAEQLAKMLPKAEIVHADGTKEDVLKEEGINYFDAIVPYTDIDEVNVLLALHANKYTDAKVVTKISRLVHNEILEGLDVGSITYPKRLITDSILSYTKARMVAGDNDIEAIYHLFDEQVEAVEFFIKKESKITGVPLRELKFKDNALIAFIIRKGKVLFPKGDECIMPNDYVMTVTTHFGYNDILDIVE